MVRERIYRYAPSNYQLNKKIKKIQQEPELKYVDRISALEVTNDPDNGITFGSTQCLNMIATGTSQNANRVGGVIKNTSIQWRGNLYVDHLSESPQPVPLSTYDYNKPMVRMIIYWDSSPNGQGHPILGSPTLAGAESLLDTTLGTESIFAPYSYATVGAGRFKILHDKTYSFNRFQSMVNIADNPSVTSADFRHTDPNIFVSGKIKLSRKTFFTGPTASVGAISTNALYVTFISNLKGTSAEKPRLYVSGNIHWRLFFKDD